MITFKDIYLTHKRGPNIYYQIRVDLGLMAMKEYLTLSKSPELEPISCSLVSFWRHFIFRDAQSARAVEYTDWTSAEG